MTLSPPPNTLVLQSHRSPRPSPWLAECMESVQQWATENQYQYQFADDALFDRLPADIAEKLLGGECRDVIVATDLARLYWLQSELDNGAETALWLDADTLVIDPQRAVLPTASFAVGRELWVQRDEGDRLRSYNKVHNALLMFRRGNPFLAYYLHAAEQIIRQHQGRHRVPQLVGPKLLTALHNTVALPVVEWAAMFSPLVAQDILSGGGEALAAFNRKSAIPPAMANLCGSSVASEQLSEQQMLALTGCLRGRGTGYFHAK